MKKIFLLGLLWWNCYSYSQQVYFNNRYDFNNELEVVWTILPVDTGYLCAVGTGKILIQYINLQGELIWQKAFGDSNKYYYAGFSNSFVPTIDGGYVLGGSIQDTSSDYNGLLIKFDGYADTLWTKEFGTTNEAFFQCKQTPDNGFILIGVKDVTQTNTNIWLVKTDSMGNFEWEKTYGGSQTEYGYTVELTLDGGYILGGFTESYGAGQSDTYIIKTDSLGNVQWSKTYGDIYRDCSAAIYPLSDGNYLVSTCIGKYILSGSYLQRRARVMKIDNAGEIIWSKEIGPARYATGAYAIHPTNDGNYIVVGQRTNQSGTPEGNGWAEGVIFKVSPEGDSLWYRVYEHNPCEKNFDYLRDIKPTSDGGFIAAGFTVPNSFDCSGDTGQQDMWVIKMDSCGCLTPLCDSVCAGLVNIMENFESGEKFKIYPNPASGYFYIENNFVLPFLIKIFDVNGKEIINQKISDKNKICNTSMLQNGVYLLQIESKGETLYSNKLIIIK